MINIVCLTPAERHERRQQHRRRRLTLLACAIWFAIGFNLAVYGCMLVSR